MEETIKIRSLEQSEWSTTLQGFQPSEIEQVLAVYNADGSLVGTICEAVGSKYYINGQPELDYPSLQAAAGALINSKR
ncbi:MAG TPA: hypothetical protein DDZ80_01110 [Cyanobacteria bacterium UBA8803]|nr:hypothetical protein [Cyanobacteria bacterium UBA9273]HBL57205.1 hypothetical protein [Cyanobacteria bacterium UBA8803]